MLRVGVDIGGTFTDLVCVNEETLEVRVVKALTTPRNPIVGLLRSMEAGSVKPERTHVFVHATTLGTNMFFGQEGLEVPRTALVTTRGFRDVIEIGRQRRPSLYDLFFEKPKPLVGRSDRFEVRERINANGEVLEPLDPEEVRSVACVIRERGYEAVAIVFLHSYVNPKHEVLAKRIILDECLGVEVVASHEVESEPGEYERTSTTVLSAMLRPLLSRYLRRLREELERRGFKGDLLVMQSSGGVVPVEEAVRMPAAFIESGPAAGAVAAACYSRVLGDEMVVAFDMGGTTAKASTIIRGEPEVVYEYEVGGKTHAGRVVKCSGYPVRYPYIDLAEVSAGGGTIAWVDPGGALRVGPKSAGADPGPACYGRGGREPTVTDANLVLGRLGESLAGGAVRLRRDLALEAIRKLADATGSSIEETAHGIVRLANTVMARAMRIVTLEKGFDPRDFTLYAFGGSGPLHAAELAIEMGIRRIVVPVHPGVFSAIGLVLADYRVERARSILKLASELDDSVVEKAYRELEEEALKAISGCRPSETRIIRRAGLRYRGQYYDVVVPWMGSVEATVKAFHEKYEALYGFSMPWEPVELSSLRVTVVGVIEKPLLKPLDAREHAPSPIARRQVFFESEGWVEVGVYRREELKPGARIPGPAVIEEYGSTTLVPPGFEASLDAYGNIVLTRE